MKLEKGLLIGFASILLAIGAQLFNDFSCYKMTWETALDFATVASIPLIPCVVVLFTKYPESAIGGSIVTIAFYALAYYNDCILPYQGGGASMVYVLVVMFGTPLSAVATVTLYVKLERNGLSIEKH
jgi:hypothetical protein